MKKILITLTVAFLSCTVVLADGGGKKPATLKKTDGPYLIYKEGNKARLIEVDATGVLSDEIISVGKATSLSVRSEKGGYSFDVPLHSIERPSAVCKKRGKTVIISDPHGDMVPFVSVLTANGVIDKQLRWSFGKNHLVIIGDIFDRGQDVLPIFWLVYKLEKEAADAGGRVDFLLGNHEEMVLRGDLRYLHKKYVTLDKVLKVSHEKLWGSDSELGRWLRTRNLVMRIGDDLFVHAGVSADFAAKGMSIDEANAVASAGLGYSRTKRVERDVRAEDLFGTKGLFWYRGLVLPDKEYFPASASDVDVVLRAYGVKRIFVGHTIFDDVSMFFGGRVVGVNVDNDDNMEDGRSRGVMLDGKDVYMIYDSGKRVKFSVNGR